MTNADRDPTVIQLVTLFTSLLTLVISGLNGYFKTEKGNEQMEAISNDGLDKLIHRVYHFPLFLSAYLFYLGSSVLISTIYPLYALVLIGFIAIACTIFAIMKGINDKLDGSKLSAVFLIGKYPRTPEEMDVLLPRVFSKSESSAFSKE